MIVRSYGSNFTFEVTVPPLLLGRPEIKDSPHLLFGARFQKLVEGIGFRWIKLRNIVVKACPNVEVFE